MKEKQNKDQKTNTELSSMPNFSMPKDAFEMVNFYGTYEIQRTADTDNQYPAIAQGFNKKIVKSDRQNPHSKNDRWETDSKP